MFKNWTEMYVFAIERQKELLREAERIRTASALRRKRGQVLPLPRGWHTKLMSWLVPSQPPEAGTAVRR